MWLLLLFFILLFLEEAHLIRAQKETYVFGELQPARSVERDAASLEDQCFYGLGLKSCRLVNIYEGLMGAAYEATAVS